MAAKLDYTYAADALATKAGVPPSLLSALINAESAWAPGAISSTGATGLGQFTKGTGTDYGLLGTGYDNRADPALNMTAMVKYLADLHKANPTWRAVVGHYSGQGVELAGYSRYSAGQALIATIAMCDGAAVPSVPGSGEGTTIIVDSITGHEQATGRPARFISALSAAVALILVGGGIVTCCSPTSLPPQQIAEKPAPAPAQAAKEERGSVWALSTFMFASGPQGELRTVPLR